ncbi:hypothetical protein F7725_020093 [Dissostichus mawsoni]|uniref:Uncharacterized protein n=1 Tax=Dissostichus mawsoni TaxID=36200 RepID=A0A7J5YLK8_DISMA|nr:hypothetical protein F7725_020093 [Dissostichus mawsoni]
MKMTTRTTETRSLDDPMPKPQKTYGCRTSPAGEKASQRTSSQNRASRPRGFRDSKNDKTASLHLEGDEDYDDDFNSHRSDLSRSELSIGEEIEEVSIEGPENSDKSRCRLHGGGALNSQHAPVQFDD